MWWVGGWHRGKWCMGEGCSCHMDADADVCGMWVTRNTYSANGAMAAPHSEFEHWRGKGGAGVRGGWNVVKVWL